MRRLVRHTLGHGHTVEAPDYRRGLLSSDCGSVRRARSAFQRGAIHLRYEAQEETSRSTAR